MDKRGLLIFDLDGTLFRTETVTIPAVRKTFQDQGLTVPPTEEIRSYFGKPTEEFFVWIRSLAPRHLADDVVSEVARREIENISETGELFPGVRDVLATLRPTVGRMAICSNGVDEYVPRVLKEHNLAAFFDLVMFRGARDTDKTRMVRHILDRFEDRPAIMIGDRQDDVEAARRNGIHSIAAAYGYGSAGELNLAELTADFPGDLTRLVYHILGGSHS